jgi:hypothetical protein
METEFAGRFKVKSGNILVTDPCYNKKEAQVVKARKGWWFVEVKTGMFGRDDKRVFSFACINGAAQSRINKTLFRAVLRRPVDSGQMGVFDVEQYQKGNKDKWYEAISNYTLNDPGFKAGAFGFVTHSGLGDGEYEVEVRQDSDGNAIAVICGFIDETDEEL